MKGLGRFQLFQFHFGTIKTWQAARWVLPGNTFQFHFGTIKTTVGYEAYRDTTISIPLWYDKNQFFAPGYGAMEISIPLWYDKNKRRLNEEGKLENFNSTLVR